MTAKILVLDIERQGALIDEVWEGKQYQNWIGPNRTIEPSRTICMAYRWEHEPRTKFVSEWGFGNLQQDNTSATPGGGHQKMFEVIHQLFDQADYIVGWNSRGFDVKHLKGGMFAYGMTPPSPHVDLDLMTQCGTNFLLPAKSLAYVSKMKGHSGKISIEHNLRRKLRYADGDVLLRAQRAMKRYNLRDVNETLALFYDMRPWLSGMNLGLYSDSDELQCSNCGGERLQWRGSAGNATYRYRRFQCQSCGKWGRDNASYTKTNVTGIK